MAYKVIISRTGEESFLKNLDYLQEEWGVMEVKAFIQKTEAVKDVLQEFPFSFPVWEYDEYVRKVPIVEQITLFYSVYESFVELLLFWNNYQDPRKLFDFLYP